MAGLSAQAAFDTMTVWLFASGIDLMVLVAIQTAEVTGYVEIEPSLEDTPFRELLFQAFWIGGLIAFLVLLGGLAFGVAL